MYIYSLSTYIVFSVSEQYSLLIWEDPIITFLKQNSLWKSYPIPEIKRKRRSTILYRALL